MNHSLQHNISQDKFAQYIRQTAHISPEQSQEIAQCFQQKTISKNSIIVQQDEICNNYYYLESGFIRAYTFDSKGKNISTDFFSDNQMVCDVSSFYGRIPSSENFETLTDCIVQHIGYEDFQRAFHSMSHFREFSRSRLVLVYAGLKQRMLSMLQLSAEERYSKLLTDRPNIFQFVPLKHIASFLGVTQTSLSRIRKEFSKKGMG